MTLKEQIDHTIKIEGGYVNHPNDKGGPTNWGVTQAVYSEWLGRPASIDDVKCMPREHAEEIYLLKYIVKPRIDTLPEELQPQLFDMAVNHGPRKAIQLFQETLNMAGFACSSDGVLGPATRKVAADAYAKMGAFLINAISERRELFYKEIVARSPSQNVFLRGWLKRAKMFRVEVPK